MIPTQIPEMTGDEKVLTQSPDVYVKSYKFGFFLTSRRIILQGDSSIPAADIPYGRVHAARPSENDQGDPSIVLYVSSAEGRRGTMILSFGERAGIPAEDERDRVLDAIRGAVSNLEDGGSAFSPPPPEAPAPVRATPNPPAPLAPKARMRGSSITSEHILVKKREFMAEMSPSGLTLRDGSDPSAPAREIPISQIRGASPGRTPAGEPTLSFSVAAPGGGERTMVLVFSLWYDGEREAEREGWSTLLSSLLPEGAVTASRSSAPPSRPSPGPAPAPRAAPRQAAFCSRCGTPIDGSARFCSSCGAPIDGQASPASSGPAEDLFPVEGERPAKKRRAKKTRGPRRRRPKGPSRLFKSQRDGMGISGLPLGEKITGFLFAPRQAFAHTRTVHVQDAILYLFVVMGIAAVVNASALLILAPDLDPARFPVFSSLGQDTVALAIFAAEGLVIGVIMVCIGAALVHLWMLIVGGGREFPDTLATCMHAATPFAAAGLIPFFGLLIAPLWTLVLVFLGLQENEGLSAGQAAGAVIFVLVVAGAFFWVLGWVPDAEIVLNNTTAVV